MYLNLENLRQTTPYTKETSLCKKSREEQSKKKTEKGLAGGGGARGREDLVLYGEKASNGDRGEARSRTTDLEVGGGTGHWWTAAAWKKE
jgi:hypothetical protein